MGNRLAKPESIQLAPASYTSTSEHDGDSSADISSPGCTSDGKPEFYLTEHHPIGHAPSIDGANIERLRRIGVMRVGDLLRVSPTDAAAELRYAGVTAEMIAAWQAQAVLFAECRACGRTTPASWWPAGSRLPSNSLRHASTVAGRRSGVCRQQRRPGCPVVRHRTRAIASH